jgi:hypothetical protein
MASGHLPSLHTHIVQRFAEFLQHAIRKRRAHAQCGGELIHRLALYTRLSLYS